MEKTLHSLVRSLRKEEIRHFRLLQQRYQLEADRKALVLFDFLLKHDADEEDKIMERLYPGGNGRNGYYRLCNGLKHQIEKSLLFQHYDGTSAHSAISYYQLHSHFVERGQRLLAIKYLHKAEQKAIEHNLFELQEMIYTAFIQLSNEENQDPAAFIEKRKQARTKYTQLQQLDDVLALLRYRIRVSQNFSGKQPEITELMEKTLKEVTGKKNTVDDPVVYFKMYEGVSRILLSTGDFTRLESYLTTSLEVSTRMGWLNKSNHEIKLQMLTYLVNASFKNRKYQQALSYCHTLKKAMEEFHGLHQEKFLFYYYNGLVNTYSVLDKQKAIEILEEALEKKEVVAETMNALFLHLQLALQLFDTGRHKQAARQLQQVYINDGFEKLDSGFRLKIKVFDVLLRNALSDFDNLMRLHNLIQKEFRDELRDEIYANEVMVLQIIKGHQSARKNTRQEALHKARELHSKLTQNTDNQNQLVDYVSWLRETFRIS